MENFKVFLRFMVVMLIPFQDSGLQAVAQRFGAYLSLIPLLPLMLLDTIDFFRNGGRIKLVHLLVVFYVLAITTYGLFAFGIESHGQSLPLKGLKQLAYILPALYVIYVFDVNHPSLRYAIYAAFAIAAAGFVAVDFLALPGSGEGSFFHFSPNENQRPRSFSTEASNAGMTIGTLGALGAFFAKTALGRIAITLLTIGSLVAVQSKGAAISILFSFAATVLLCRALRPAHRFALLAGVIIVAVVISNFVLEAATGAMLDGGGMTFATRGTLAVMTWVVALNHPLGVGLAAQLPAFSEYGPTAMTLVENAIGLPLNFNEVSGYFLGRNANAVDAKSIVNNMIMFFGFPFLAWFARVHYRLYRERIRTASGRELFLATGIVFTSLAYTGYISDLEIFSCLLVYAIAFRWQGFRAPTNAEPDSAGK